MYIETNNSVERLIGGIRRQNLEAKQRAQEKAYSTTSSVLLLVDDLAGFAIFDAYNKFISSPIYKQALKKAMNDAYRSYKNWERDFLLSFKGEDVKQLFMDFADNYQDITKKHVDMLRISILQVLTKLAFPHREEISYIMCAYCATKYACLVYDDFFKKQRDVIGADARDACPHFYLEGVRKEWRKLVSLAVPIEIECKVAKDPNFILACRCMALQGTMDDNLQRISEDVIQKDKEVIEKYGII